jgi:hypothetical protein
MHPLNRVKLHNMHTPSHTTHPHAALAGWQAPCSAVLLAEASMAVPLCPPSQSRALQRCTWNNLLNCVLPVSWLQLAVGTGSGDLKAPNTNTC